MRKFFLSALAAFLLAPVAMFADSWTKTVTDKATFDAALKTIGAGIAGETYTVVCDWGNDVVVAASRFSSQMKAGTLVVKSNQTNYTKMPTLSWQFQQSVLADSLSTDAISLILENLHIYNTNDVVTFRQDVTHIDTFAILNCDVDAGTGGTRTVFRGDGNNADKTARLSYIKNFIVKDSKFHGYNAASANNWSTFRPFMPVLKIEAVNNMFYNFVYSKGIFECRYPGQQPANIYFNNNAVICARANAYTGNTTYSPLSFGGNFAEGSVLYACNNIFMAPVKGTGSVVGKSITVITSHMGTDSVMKYDTIVRPFEASDYKNTEFTNLSKKAEIYAFGNIFDTLAYKPLEAMDSILLNATSKLEYTDEGKNPNTTLDSYKNFTWNEGEWFQDPAADMYFVLQTSPWKTAGYNVSTANEYADWGKPTNVGPSWMYVESFPQRVAVKVTVNGPSYCSYSISPVKPQYYTGDEIKVSVADKNNYYRTFTSFDSWEGAPAGVDISVKNLTFKLTGDLNLVANYTRLVNPIAAFQITADPKSTELKADIYHNMDIAYQAKAYYLKNDTLTGNILKDAPSYVNHVFRGSKFSDSEEDPSLHQSTTRTSTLPAAKTAGKRDMIIVKACTKNFKNINAAAIVGTDNNMSRKVLCLYSLDGKSFTACGNVDVPNALKWAEVVGTLPADCNDKDSVFIAFQEDPAAKVFADYIYNKEAFKDASGVYLTGAELEAKVLADATFMYVGNILLTGETIVGIENVKANNKLNKTDAIYNVLGQKVNENYRGIVIKNGKKYMNK